MGRSVAVTEDIIPFRRFFLPGPTAVRPEVLAAQYGALIGHRGPAMKALMEKLQLGLKDVFRTSRPVLISTSSATGFMESAVRNGARARVLSLVNGAFSKRFAEIAMACGFEVDSIEVEWGQTITPEAVRKRLSEGGVDTVTVVHSETSTGALNPLAEIAGVVQEFEDVLLVVDSVTGVGGVEVRTDEWKLDFVLTGSQKALALPPGLAFAVASDRMMDRSKKACGKGVYFDLTAFREHIDDLQTPNTPAISLMYALAEQLRRISVEGMESRWARHRAMADRCAEWVESMGHEKGLELAVVASEGERSPTVTCIALPEGISGPTVVSAMRNRGFVIGGGYGKLKEGAIRIGHMGDHSVAELNEVLQELEGVLK